MASSSKSLIAKASATANDVWNTTQTVSFNVQVANDAVGGVDLASFRLQVNDGAQNPSVISPAVSVVGVTPTPQIMIVSSVSDLANCANGSVAPNGANETDVYAGQQVLLCVAPPPTGLSIQSQSWSFENSADIIGGFTNTAGNGPPSGSGGGRPVGAILNQSSLTVYFINPGGSETATYSWVLNNGNADGASSTADFNIEGPTGNILPNVFTQGNSSGTLILDSPNGSPNPNANPATMQMGNAPLNPHVGIWFNDLPTLPANSGSFVWVQILNSTTYSQLFQNGVGYNPPSNIGLGLDGEYPYLGGEYSPNTTTSDAPGRTDLYSFLGEAGESFDATMYVLWDPAIPPSGQSTCTAAWIDTTTTPYTPHPSTCSSIPVPLASVEWTWSACAINSLTAGPNGSPAPLWAVNCGQGGYSDPKPSGYPTWTTCDASKFGKCE
jgi:hypothetical protein